MTVIDPNKVQITKPCLEYMGLNIQKFLISQNISTDLKGPKENTSFSAWDGLRYFIVALPEPSI